MPKFTELTTISADARKAYEDYFPADVRVPVSDLAQYMSLGNLRLFATYNDAGQFIAGSFITVGMLDVAPITFQSFMFSVDSLTSDALEDSHIKNIKAQLAKDYGKVRLLFEVQDPNDTFNTDVRDWRNWYVRIVTANGGTKLTDSHYVDASTRFQLWNYAVSGQTDTPTQAEVSEWIYITLRFAYGMSASDARSLLAKDGLSTGNVSEFEKKAAKIA